MTTLITGATSGIGYQTAFKMAEFGSDLILPVRNLEKGNQLKNELIAKFPNLQVHIYQVDFASLQSTKNLVEELKKDNLRFQILINNAGLWQREKLLSVDGIEQTLAVNHLAPFLLTNLIVKAKLLQNELSKKARIVNLSSMGHYFAKPNWDDLEFKNSKFNSSLGYYNSKLFNVLFTQKLARILSDSQDLELQNITCNCLHPGIVNTKLLVMPAIVRRVFGGLIMTPEKGANTSFFVATDSSLEDVTGQYFDNSKIKKPSKLATVENQDRLWEISEKMLAKFLD